ncbi:MAG: hypothetical protein IT249_05950 [Chitinophagaceae bacterium]|nr:hypothetical protein [Chitinophagaceae bacterium]
MIIHIIYKDVIIKGRVIYDLRAIKNIVIVYLEQKITGIENEIMLIYQNAVWEEADGMQLKYPELFNQITNRLAPVLKRCAMTYSEPFSE